MIRSLKHRIVIQGFKILPKCTVTRKVFGKESVFGAVSVFRGNVVPMKIIDCVVV